MEINWKHTTYSLLLLFILAMAVILLRRTAPASPSDTYYKHIKDENARLDSINKQKQLFIDSVIRDNKTKDSLIFRLERKKRDIEYVYISKFKEIDDASVSYLVDDFENIFKNEKIGK